MADTSCCGCNCGECKDYGKTCNGCNALQGRVYWTGYVGMETCPIYACCVREKGYKDCGPCEGLPCEIYYQCVDPSMTPEQHALSVQQRVQILRKPAE